MAHSRTLIHLGCGPKTQKTKWIDYDGSWNARINMAPSWLRKMVRRAINHKHEFPEHVQFLSLGSHWDIKTANADAVYASHVWEHLRWDTALFATTECHRVLKPNGWVRLVVPNLRDLTAEYLSDPSNYAALNFNKRLHFHALASTKNPILRCYESLTQFHYHKVMYDPQLLKSLLRDAGFINVEEKAYGESCIPEILEVESDRRVGPGFGFAIEGQKP